MFGAYARRDTSDIGNVFAYDLEGKLVRDHLFIDIFSWNQCPPAIAVGSLSHVVFFQSSLEKATIDVSASSFIVSVVSICLHRQRVDKECLCIRSRGQAGERSCVYGHF